MRRPEKVLQFGSGNFLRAFADWMIDRANREGSYDGSIVICQPTDSARGAALNAQNGQFTVITRGLENGRPVERLELVTSVSRCINPYRDYEALLALARSPELEVIISNTTEAGIVWLEGDALTDRPPASFPAKLCAFLYERYRAFAGAKDVGLLILSCELIENNGRVLMEYVLKWAEVWKLGPGFSEWIEKCCIFCGTLVDRIVSGYPAGEEKALWKRIGFEDRCMTVAEPFYLWVIGPPERKCTDQNETGLPEWAGRLQDRLPLQQAGLHVKWVGDLRPYKTRKVRILNGAHTGLSLAGILAGHRYVREMMLDPVFSDRFEQLIYREVIPAMSYTPARAETREKAPADAVSGEGAEGTAFCVQEELLSFAEETKNRFLNPCLHHRLLDISLNSCAKMRSRVLPSLLDWYALKRQVSLTESGIRNQPPAPEALCFAFASFLRFYRIAEKTPDHYYGTTLKGESYEVRDSLRWLRYFTELWNKATDRGGMTGGPPRAEITAAGDGGCRMSPAQYITDKALGSEELWGMDLRTLPGFAGEVERQLTKLLQTENVR